MPFNLLMMSGHSRKGHEQMRFSASAAISAASATIIPESKRSQNKPKVHSASQKCDVLRIQNRSLCRFSDIHRVIPHLQAMYILEAKIKGI
jgi:hypothetical protein